MSPKNGANIMKPSVIGLDIGKNIMTRRVVRMSKGQSVLHKKFSQDALIEWLA
jgi:hypothetical protein